MELIYIGIDPGPKYTGVSVINENKEVLLSATYVRPDELEPITWATVVTQKIQEEVIPLYPGAKIGIEGVTTPGSHLNGKISLMNPKHLIRLSYVVGSLAQAFPNAVVIKAGKNGSQPLETYPECLKGRRPKDLAGTTIGAGTRNHERSAYDVAKGIKQRLDEGYKLDMVRNIFDD